jgi:hypothetical protein
MMTVSPVITRETTIWRVWLGLNASLSLGLILFGALYGYLAILQSAVFFRSTFLLALGLTFLLSYAVVARLYFFSAPLRGIAVAAVLYISGIVVNRAYAS